MFVREFLPKLWRLADRENSAGRLSEPMPHTSRQLHCLTSYAWNCNQAAVTGTLTSWHDRSWITSTDIHLETYNKFSMNITRGGCWCYAYWWIDIYMSVTYGFCNILLQSTTDIKCRNIPLTRVPSVKIKPLSYFQVQATPSGLNGCMS